MLKSKYLLVISIFCFCIIDCADVMARNIKVVATIFPAFDFAGEIAGNKADIIQLLPAGVEAHGYSPTPRDLISISEADIFIYCGDILEPWADDIRRAINPESLTIVDASQGIRSKQSVGEKHNRQGPDPHFWLDPLLAKKMVQTIATALAGVDPENATEYNSNTIAYLTRLSNLDREIRRTLNSCKHRTIISGGHFAFGLFAKRYNLSHLSPYKNFSPNAAPSIKSLSRLIETFRETGQSVLFIEELVEPKMARIIAQETGAKLLLLHGIHNTSKSERQRGVNYISLMRDNLLRLKEGLECK